MKLIIIILMFVGIIFLLTQKFKAWEDIIILSSGSIPFGFLYWIMALDNFPRFGYEILVFRFITICHAVPMGIIIYLISKKKITPQNATLFRIDKYFIKKILLFIITLYFSFLMIFIINNELIKIKYPKKVNIETILVK